MDSLTIPVKCSMVRSINNIVEVVNLTLFIIYCIVSSIYLVLMVFGVIQLDGSIWGVFLFLGGYIGVTISCSVIVIYIYEGLKWIIARLPELKCIED